METLLTKEEREMIRLEVKRDVNILFDRVYNIKKIRRKRKIKSLIHLNYTLK